MKSYSNKWSFVHPADYRGHVWIKIMPKPENKNKIHKFSIMWERWQFEGKLDFKKDSSVILDFKKIAEDKSWPIEFKISPSAFVVSGKGNPVIDINKGWKCIDRKGLWKVWINRFVQLFMADTKREGVKVF